MNYVTTVPGDGGLSIAFAAEAAISFILMSTVLIVSNVPALARFTGVTCGLLVASYIAIEAPVSGMSMNPARTFASALAAGQWHALWIYFSAPPFARSRPRDRPLLQAEQRRGSQPPDRRAEGLDEATTKMPACTGTIAIRACSRGICSSASESLSPASRTRTETSALDVNCKAHEVDNLYVVDGSFFP